jgi:hypothetical protein
MKCGTHLQGWSIWHLPNPTWTIVYLHHMLAPQNNKHNCMCPCWESSYTPNLILQLKDDLLIVQRSSCSNQNGTSSSKPNSSDGASSSHFFIPSTPKLKALQLQRWTLHNVKGSEYQRMIPHYTDWKPKSIIHTKIQQQSYRLLQHSIFHHLSMTQNYNVESGAAWELLEKQELVTKWRILWILNKAYGFWLLGWGFRV